ncbi:SCO6745 family protein [Streptomyces mauvecolor]
MAARHIPSAWETIPPEASVAVRERGSAASVRRILGDELADSPGLVRAADLTTKAATNAPAEGRVMYAGMRTLAVPNGPVARLWHSATMLREHRCDGHVAALVGARVDGTEAHALDALARGIHRSGVMVRDGLREWGLVDTDGGFTDASRETKRRIEALTDDLAAPPYDTLIPAELDELVTELEPSLRRWWPPGRSDEQRLRGRGVRRLVRRVLRPACASAMLDPTIDLLAAPRSHPSAPWQAPKATRANPDPARDRTPG